MDWSIDPLKMMKLLWPDVMLYKQQKDIVYSVWNDDETIVPAGNMLGKDFVAGVIVVLFFLIHPRVKIITTSATQKHLDNLWGEIDRFIRTSRYTLDFKQGGPLVYSTQTLKKVVNGQIHKDTYALGMVVSSDSKGEGLSGHHAPATLFVCDEGSGVADVAYSMAQGWAKHMLIIGNPNPCVNFFFRGVQGGPIKAEDNGHYHRQVIKIKAEHSPNVRYALSQKAKGIKPTKEDILEGVLSYPEYLKRRATWDPIRQCIGLDAEFYEGAEVLLYPPEWLNAAEQVAQGLRHQPRRAETIGVDSAQGGDNTAWAVCDHLGLIKLISMKTPDTTVIVNRTIALMQEYRVGAKNVLFDGGGGGYQHACTMRNEGHDVRVIMFGGAPTKPRKRARTLFTERVEQDEVKYVYTNRRCEMYGELRLRMDPSTNEKPFALPAEYTELRRQLAPLPLLFDGEGRLRLPPKNKPKPDSKETTIVEILGCSPDEADALVLAHFGLLKRTHASNVGAF